MSRLRYDILLRRAYLEHLNVRHAEKQVRRIAKNKTTREQETDRQDGLYEHILCHAHVLGPVQ
jgi:hypothetical protein